MNFNCTLLKKSFSLQPLLLAVMLCLSMASPGQTLHNVEVRDTEFIPNELEIHVGDTVEWRNTLGYHNVNGTQATYPSNPESFGNSEGEAGWVYQHVFTTAGTYDYRCNPHYELGMTGKLTVLESGPFMLTVNFNNMNPHVGQDFYLAVVDKATGNEAGRIHLTAETVFMAEVFGIETGKSYHIDFWADHNRNGKYDAPPTDHAWRLELDTVTGPATLDFIHNVNFTDIMWKNQVTVQFNNMNPHIGQDFFLAVLEKNSGTEVGRVHQIAETEFEVMVSGIEPGKSYHVDFWADHNRNGRYDAPPTDHAWRLTLDSIMGDTTLVFVHNVNFTDIMWKYMVTVDFTAMNPHVGQDFYLSVTDTLTGMVIGRKQLTAEVEFTVMVPGIESGKAYHVDFWADHNRNGRYDPPGADHAWRLTLDSIMGDTTLMFVHNVNFTDVMWKNRLTVEFTGMNPHIGQMLVLYVVNTEDDMVQDTVAVQEIMEPDFAVHSYSITPGNSYHVNFYADFNQNGVYDAPPVDHAWQLMLDSVSGDTTLMFAHNTNFTDIFPVTSSPLIESQALKVYPNPAKSKVWIESSHLNPKDYTLSVYDISGRLMDLESLKQNNRIELNVQYLNKGIYFLHLQSVSEKITMKLIKN